MVHHELLDHQNSPSIRHDASDEGNYLPRYDCFPVTGVKRVRERMCAGSNVVGNVTTQYKIYFTRMFLRFGQPFERFGNTTFPAHHKPQLDVVHLCGPILQSSCVAVLLFWFYSSSPTSTHPEARFPVLPSTSPSHHGQRGNMSVCIADAWRSPRTASKLTSQFSPLSHRCDTSGDRLRRLAPRQTLQLQDLRFVQFIQLNT